MSRLLLGLLLALAGRSPAGDLERGETAFRAGQYEQAARALEGLPARLPRNADYAIYLEAESVFYQGEYAKARGLFAALARHRTSRFAPIGPWRIADCLWAEGRRGEAVAAYRRLPLARPPAGADAVVARFRMAEQLGGEEGKRLFHQIHVEAPAHPLAAEAARRGGPTAAPPELAPRDRLKRAEVLAEGKRYDEALVEFGRLPKDLPADLAAERDFELGVAKFRMRNDYPHAAQLLLGVAPKLSGEKAAFAAFHGARALSRVDRDDEAIAEYGKVVEKFPSSRWAAEAQFLSGRLEFNRGRFREALPGLRATLARFGRSAFANDAAWFLAFSSYLLGQAADALAALDQYARLSGNDPDAAKRVLYWRGRFLAKQGKTDEGRTLLRDCMRRWPLNHYGLLARARLRAEGQAVEAPFEKGERGEALPAKPAAARDPAVARADELLVAGLATDAGLELERDEETFSRRVGREAALAVLFDRYPKMESFRRARQLAEGRSAALAVAPTGAARVIWEAAFPRAFSPWVEKYGPPAGNPDLFLYATMHKESAFSRFVVSPADARGLLQLIPDVGKKSAAQLGVPFHEDELFDAETNIRFGATYIGGLAKTFGGQVYLTAAAFNAGHKATMRWCDRYGQHPLDEFVELITYEDTREYVKRMVGIYAHYLYLYRNKLYELPLTFDARYGKYEP